MPPDLITYDYCEAALSEVALTDGQRDFIPYLISAASEAVRRYCFNRYFDWRNNIVEVYPISLDGYVRLYQVPVSQVLRIQANPQLALTIVNNSPSIQFAQAYFAYTGQAGTGGVNPQVATGIVLNWTSSGVLNTQTIAYTGGMIISNLATLINGIGAGWNASTDAVLGLWPVTELDGGYVSQGCALSATPDTGAQFNVLLDITCGQLTPNGQRTGFLWVGNQYSNSTAARWGPGGDELFGYPANNASQSRAKITYAAGYTTIPPDVQYWTAQLVKWKTEVAKQEFLLMQEKAADYSYVLADQMVHAMPATVREGLAQWRLHYA